jgi:hypothetical protein
MSKIKRRRTKKSYASNYHVQQTRVNQRMGRVWIRFSSWTCTLEVNTLEDKCCKERKFYFMYEISFARHIPMLLKQILLQYLYISPRFSHSKENLHNMSGNLKWQMQRKMGMKHDSRSHINYWTNAEIKREQTHGPSEPETVNNQDDVTLDSAFCRSLSNSCLISVRACDALINGSSWTNFNFLLRISRLMA